MELKPDGTAPLYVVDGVIVNENVIKDINPANIGSVNVIKEVEPATEKYGEKGKNGVVEIVTIEKSLPNIDINSIEKSCRPLHLLLWHNRLPG